MTKADLMAYVGKKVRIVFKDSWSVSVGIKPNYLYVSVCGTLGYADEFSKKHDFRKPNYFYIGNVSFKVSHVKKVIESEG